jgi:hypothetical protein
MEIRICIPSEEIAMTELENLQRRLRALDEQEEALHQERATVMREFVAAAGGLTEAAGKLKADPRTLVQLQRRDEVAFVVYRGPDPSPVIDGHVYGETGAGDASAAQRWADAHWWRIAATMRPKIRLLIVVVKGRVRRIWEVMPAGDWEVDPLSGKVGLPLAERPLTPDEVGQGYPDLGISVDDERPARQGLMREYVPVRGS